MKKRTSETAMAVGAVLVACLVPIMASLYLAHRHTVADARARAGATAGNILHRVDLLGASTDVAYRRLASDASAPCSNSHIRSMRDVDLTSVAVRATGYVIGNKMVCSSLTGAERAIDLGPVTYTTPRGVRVRTSVKLDSSRSTSFLVQELNGYAIATLPNYLIDVGPDRSDVALGAYSTTGGLLARRGTFNPAWRTFLGQSREATYYDGRYLVVLRRSPTYNIAAYAAIPAVHLHAAMRDAELTLVPVGIALGLVSAIAAFWLLRQRASLPVAIRAGLRKGEFSLQYQPIFRLSDRQPVGFEALIRWERGDQCIARPDVFIPVAEGCGLIRDITRFVVDRLKVELPQIAAVWPGHYVSFNLSGQDLSAPSTVHLVRELLTDAGLPPSSIMIEATEHSLVDGAIAARVLNDLRDIGIRIAIDDFGTGYSNLAYLATMKCDVLKIDRMFVDAAGTDSVTKDVALHILRMAQALNIDVVAEGIEGEAQALFLRENGVQFGQGWLFGKPMPLQELLAPPEHRTRTAPDARAQALIG